MNLELVQDEMPIGLNTEALEEWIEYRRIDHKKPMSELAIKKTRNLLMKYSLEHQQFLVDHAMRLEWKGLHHVEMPKQNETRGRTLQQDLTDRSWV